MKAVFSGTPGCCSSGIVRLKYRAADGDYVPVVDNIIALNAIMVVEMKNTPEHQEFFKKHAAELKCRTPVLTNKEGQFFLAIFSTKK